LAAAPLSFDLIIGGIPRFAAEAPWAWRLLSRYARRLPAATRVETPGRAPTVADASGTASLVLVCADPEAYLLPRAALRLLASLAARPDVGVLLPVANETPLEAARAAPGFATVTPSLLEEAVEEFARRPPELIACAEADSPVFVARRAVLEALPPALALVDLPREAARQTFTAAIDPGAYVHRYGAMDAQPREDLAAHVPPGARAVLDVGCARGAAAGALEARGVAAVYGIEPDAESAREASRRYDRVVALPLEEVDEDWAGRFDAVLFGDVLEHLADPSGALERVRPWLAPNGVVVASVPNLGHWAIVSDLIEGRFDYVPYSLLSGTHVRFFTRASLRELFEASGYAVERIETVELAVSPAGAAKLARLLALPEASPDLTAAEFVVVARARIEESRNRRADRL
jgi:2-polyprenyl-3-methyl-5-hydroxy-6-metoxy-1,4-benzoquinol methylase